MNSNMKTRIAIIAAILIVLCMVTPSFAAVTIVNSTKGDYEYAEFQGSGSVTWSRPANVTAVDYLLVAGGGGGGYSQGGGGGGGGTRSGTGLSIGATVAVVVGAGGAGANSAVRGSNGGNSSIDAIVADGGGGGGTTAPGYFDGGAGGSGGGGAYTGVGGAGTSGQGHDGGAGYTSGTYGAGGGGGSEEVGTAGVSAHGGYGGQGLLYDLSGVWRRYGGGAGGGAYQSLTPGFPGSGGGGDGGGYLKNYYRLGGVSGADGYGGGGGGGGTNGGAGAGGNGGSGLVVIRWVGDVKASFTSDVTSGVIPLTVQFEDTSSGQPTSWYWEFGDGSTSTSENPSHTYTSYGFYTVNMKSTSATTSDWSNVTSYISVLDINMFTNNTYIKIDGSSNALWNYEVPFWLIEGAGTSSGNVIYTSTVRNDWADIRFTARDDSNTVQGANYWIETYNATHAKVWVNMPYIPSSGCNLTFYYGNASLSNSLSNRPKTFKKFDDFEDGTLDAWDTREGFEWQPETSVVKTGSYSIRGRNFLTQDNQGGVLTTFNDSRGELYSNYSVSLDFYANSLGTDSCGGGYILTRFAQSGASYDEWYTREDIYSWQLRDFGRISYNTGIVNSARVGYSSTLYSADTWYNTSLTFDQVAGTMAVTMNGAQIGSTAALFYGEKPFYPHGRETLNSSHSGIIALNPSGTFVSGDPIHYTYIDNFRVRSYYNPEPHTDGTLAIPPVTADFSANVTTGIVPLAVSFTDLSSDANAWSWVFGDGNTSTSQNPTNTYAAAGTYTVNLTASNSEGSDTESKTSYITVNAIAAPTAAFSANVTSGVYNLPVHFTDSSINATSWYWEFGDGNTSAVQNPDNTYGYSGLFSVHLKSTNAGGSDWENKTNYITVGVPGGGPTANFVANVTSGVAPLPVQFTDSSSTSGTISNWYWDFDNDGAVDSIQQSPIANFTTAGTYTVNLTIIDEYGQDGEIKTNYISVGSPLVPVAQFSANITYGTAPLVVQFTDLSSNSPSSWKWNFTTGSSDVDSTSKDPVHTYTEPGSYSVNLTAGNAFGTNTIIKLSYITVVNETVSTGAGAYYAPHQVRFTAMKESGLPYPGLYITAVPSNTTLGDWSWLYSLFGISQSVDFKNTTMTGYTGSDGAITFVMSEDINYALNFFNSSESINYNINIMPKDTDYIITIPGTSGMNLTPQASCLNITGGIGSSSGTATIWALYTDSCGSTSNVTVWARHALNNSFITSVSDTTIGTTPNNISATFGYVPGADYEWLITYNTTYENKSFVYPWSAPITPSAEVPAWILQWAAVGFLVLLTAVFSIGTVKFGVILIPVFAGVFAFMGWISIGAAVVPFLLSIGVLYYIRAQEQRVV